MCRAAFFAVQCIKTCEVFLRQILIQGADSLGVEELLIKMISRHVLEFEKYANIEDVIQQLLT